jgi:hypothetical protein
MDIMVKQQEAILIFKLVINHLFGFKTLGTGYIIPGSHSRRQMKTGGYNITCIDIRFAFFDDFDNLAADTVTTN